MFNSAYRLKNNSPPLVSPEDINHLGKPEIFALTESVAASAMSDMTVRLLQMNKTQVGKSVKISMSSRAGTCNSVVEIETKVHQRQPEPPPNIIYCSRR